MFHLHRFRPVSVASPASSRSVAAAISFCRFANETIFLIEDCDDECGPLQRELLVLEELGAAGEQIRRHGTSGPHEVVRHLSSSACVLLFSLRRVCAVAANYHPPSSAFMRTTMHASHVLLFAALLHISPPSQRVGHEPPPRQHRFAHGSR